MNKKTSKQLQSIFTLNLWNEEREKKKKNLKFSYIIKEKER